MSVNRVISKFISRYPFQILDHLVKDKYIDKNLYKEFKIVFDHFETELPYYFNNSDFECSDAIRKENKLSDLSINNIERYLDEKKWSLLFTSSNIVWDRSLILKYEDKLNWDKADSENSIGCLSQASNVAWTDDLIEEFFRKFNIELLCKNKSIAWNDRLLSLLSLVPQGPFNHVIIHNAWIAVSNAAKLTIDLIDKYEKFLSFYSLSRNTNIEWSILLIDKYIEKWDWQGLSGNPSLPWSLSFLTRYESKLVWKRGHPYPSSRSSSISTNPGIHWSMQSVLAYEDQIDFFEIAKFGSPDESVLVRFFDKFNSLRLTGSKHHKYSDWHDSHNVYDTAWSALSENENFEFSYDLLLFLAELDSPCIYYEGSARSGFTEKNKSCKAATLLEYCKIKNEDIQQVLDSKLVDHFINSDKAKKRKQTTNSYTVRIQPYINQSIWNWVRPHFDKYSNLKSYLNQLSHLIITETNGVDNATTGTH